MYRLYKKPCPVVFQFIPQCVAGIGKVPCTSLNEEPILYLSLKQEGVQYFILPVLCNPSILSNSIKIFILVVRHCIVRVPKNIMLDLSSDWDCWTVGLWDCGTVEKWNWEWGYRATAHPITLTAHFPKLLISNSLVLNGA